MKKVLIALTLLLTIFLSGCDKENTLKDEMNDSPPMYYVCYMVFDNTVEQKNNDFLNKQQEEDILYIECIDFDEQTHEMSWEEFQDLYDWYDDFYTKEEVDLLLLQQSTELLQFMVDNLVQYNKEDNAIYADCYIVDNVKQCDIILDLDEDYALLTENQYQDLLQRIEELEQEEIVFTSEMCSTEELEYMVDDIFDWLEDLSRESYTYSYQVDEYGNLLQFNNGEYNTTISIQEFLEYYCGGD